jgi:CP family cyanate transporter-like MFS transporter
MAAAPSGARRGGIWDDRPVASERGDRSAGIATFLVALGVAWTVGNVGGSVAPLSEEFDLSLATVGVLSGSLLLGFSIPGTLLAPAFGERFGIVRTMIFAAVICAVGNLVFAASPDLALLIVGRAISGFALGIAVVLGPVFARTTGGVVGVAIFGAAIQLGIAGGLGLSAVLSDAGVDWRFTFLLSALVAASAIPLLLPREEISYERGGGTGFLRPAIRSARVWRLGALFISIFSVPLILGSWLVHYLDVDNGLATGTAGVLSFVMFGVSAAARDFGGQLAQRGFSPALLSGGAPFLAAIGLAILALDDSLAFAVIAVLTAGVGFALPYGIAVVQAQRLYPAEPTEPVALVTLVGSALPVPLVPLIGSLLDDGYGAEVFLVLAALVAAAGALNLRPVTGSLEPQR